MYKLKEPSPCDRVPVSRRVDSEKKIELLNTTIIGAKFIGHGRFASRDVDASTRMQRKTFVIPFSCNRTSVLSIVLFVDS